MEDRSPLYTERFGKALMFAADQFAYKTRKGNGSPYVTHLLGTATYVMRYGGSEDASIAALLHDYYEDIKDAKPEVVKDLFGPRVHAIVQAVTEDKKLKWRPRKEHYIETLRHTADPDVKLVASADKLDNVRAMIEDYVDQGEDIWKKFNAGPRETMWFYAECLKALRQNWSNRIIDELEFEVFGLALQLNIQTEEPVEA